MFFKKFIRKRSAQNVKMNKPVDLGLSILKISKTLTYEFCFD